MGLNPRGLPELLEWTLGSEECNLQGFMSTNVEIADATAPAALCRPEFVEYRGCVFLAFTFDRNGVDEWLARHAPDPAEVLETLN